MNGAESMLETLINAGVEVCFSNPGTSEMHMVAAIGKSDKMRSPYPSMRIARTITCSILQALAPLR